MKPPRQTTARERLTDLIATAAATVAEERGYCTLEDLTRLGFNSREIAVNMTTIADRVGAIGTANARRIGRAAPSGTPIGEPRNLAIRALMTGEKLLGHRGSATEVRT